MEDISNIKKPERLYRGQELQINLETEEAINVPEKILKPRSVFGGGKTATGDFIGDAVFATSSYKYASIYTIPKVDAFSTGFIGYHINQNFLIISHFAKTYYERFPEDFGYVYTIENTSSFSPVLINGQIAEWYTKDVVVPSMYTKINGLDDILKHSQVLYLSPNISWEDWDCFSARYQGKISEIYHATQRGVLISYNQEKNINCVDFKIQEELKNKKDNIFKRLLAEKFAGKRR